MLEQNQFHVSSPYSSEEDIKNQRCSICGSYHCTRECSYLIITSHIMNKKVLSKARLSLPDGLKIDSLADGSYRVVTATPIQEGTRFGPLDAKKSITLNPKIQFPIKVFPYGAEEFLEYYLDTSNEEECTWMIFVESASTYEEQNLICYQDEGCIYYATIKDVEENECLKVWYSPYYAEKMEKKILTTKKTEVSRQLTTSKNEYLSKLVNLQQNILDRDSWTCKFCGAIKADVMEFANHIYEHYMAQLKRKCEICKHTFISKKSLWKHMKLFHDPHKTKRKSALTPTPDIPSNRKTSRELSIGGPLLNNMELVYNLDNSNLLMPTLDRMGEDLHDMGTENLNVDNLLTENVRALDHFNFEIGECQEEFVCDICVKSFSKLPYLVQHLRRHTGENVCYTCKKVFCRKENLGNHACTSSINYKCDPCGRTFLQKKFYNRHNAVVHNEKFKCYHCNYNYCNNYELSRHNCKAKSQKNRRYSCTVCRKEFLLQTSIRKHMLRRHSSKIAKAFICEICAKQYIDKHAHDIHMKTHEDPQFQCDVCQKKFYRKDVYQNHLLLHEDQELECSTCKKKFNCAKNLSSHMSTHKEATFKCVTCDATFKYKSNLIKHCRNHRKPKKSVDLISCFTCPYCGKKVTLKSSLSRHINRSHPEQKNKLLVPQPTKLTQKEHEVTFPADSKNLSFLNNGDLDLMTNSKDNIDLMNDADINELESDLQIQMIDNILLNTTKEMGIGLNDDLLDLNNLGVTSSLVGHESPVINVENREICLSMPDLMEEDQDITLGENAYILDNGTIVQPQEFSNNVVVYVLNQPKV